MTQKHPYVPQRKDAKCAICQRKREEHEREFFKDADGKGGYRKIK